MEEKIKYANLFVKTYIILTTIYLINYLFNGKIYGIEKLLVFITLLSFLLYFIESYFLSHAGYIIGSYLLPFNTNNNTLLLVCLVALISFYLSQMYLGKCIINLNQGVKKFTKLNQYLYGTIHFMVTLYTLSRIFSNFDINKKIKLLITYFALIIFSYDLLAYYKKYPTIIFAKK